MSSHYPVNLNRSEQRVTMTVVEISQFMTPTCDAGCVTCSTKFTSDRSVCLPRLSSRFVRSAKPKPLPWQSPSFVPRNVWPSSLTTLICSRTSITQSHRSPQAYARLPPQSCRPSNGRIRLTFATFWILVHQPLSAPSCYFQRLAFTAQYPTSRRYSIARSAL